MICRACREGRHGRCEHVECECPKEIEEKLERDLAAHVNGQGDAGLAETIYDNLLYGGSQVARLLTEGAGKAAVRLFIQQVLRANRGLKG